MDATGLPAICRGLSCLSNAPLGNPTLGYGQTIGTGPFTCLSEVSGVACTVVSGRGFTISSSGITPSAEPAHGGSTGPTRLGLDQTHTVKQALPGLLHLAAPTGHPALRTRHFPDPHGRGALAGR